MFSFSFSGRVDRLNYVYFYAQKLIIKSGDNKFQDLINASRIWIISLANAKLVVQIHFGHKMLSIDRRFAGLVLSIIPKH